MTQILPQDIQDLIAHGLVVVSVTVASMYVSHLLRRL